MSSIKENDDSWLTTLSHNQHMLLEQQGQGLLHTSID